MRLVPACQIDRLGRVVGRQAAFDPRLLPEHQTKTPVHHVVVVDDEDS